MDTMLHVELTDHERDILLRGLRYVRSAIMLEQRNPNRDDENRRASQLDEIQNLFQRLESAESASVRI